MNKWLIIKIGKDPLYWVNSFSTKKEAYDFINDQIDSFPQRFDYIIAKYSKEIYDK